jgi:hypothetical protein
MRTGRASRRFAALGPRVDHRALAAFALVFLSTAGPHAASPAPAIPAPASPAPAAPAPAAAAAAPAAADSARLSAAEAGVPALLVFVSSQSEFDLPLSPARLRAETGRDLREALRQRGLVLLDPAVVAPLQQRWRVRSGLALDPAFMDALAAATGSRTLVVAQLIGSPEHVTLAARWLELASSRLLWVGIAEARVAAAAADTAGARALWQAGLREAATRLAAGWRPPEVPRDAAAVMVLPAGGIGVDLWQTDLATHCLLRDLLAQERRAVLDPGALVASLANDGRDPGAPDAAGLRRLGQKFHCAQALLPDLISYAPETSTALPGAGPAATGASDLALSLRSLDTRSGTVTAAADIFVPVPIPTGWFGRPAPLSPLAQLETVCQRLLADFRPLPED